VIAPVVSTFLNDTANKCAFVIHGLNTNPKRMHDLARLAQNAGFETTIGILSGHHNNLKSEDSATISAENWQSEFLNQWSNATKKCINRYDQKILIGYSLGALLGLTLFDGATQIEKPTKMILVAPALTLQNKTLLIRAISFIPFGGLPSANHPDYRARAWTPFSEYAALFKLNDRWKKTAWSKTAQVPTLVALEAKDELVDSKKIEQQIKERQMTHWTIEWISNQSSQLKPKYHHLIIDERSQGAEQWKKFSERVMKFLAENNPLK
jgi:esterase/lipase